MPRIHPTAVVHPDARLADDVEVGAHTVIEAGVEIGAGCVIGPLCRFEGPTTVACSNRFISHCSVGAPPQDIGYKGEQTRLEIGPNNTFREFVTIHRGTVKGGGTTRLGGHSLYMAYAHIAHDCRVGDHVIFANAGTLAGHVDIGDFASIGAFTAVHQFCRVGEHAFLGGFTVATQDCLPFMKTVGGRPASCYGPNTVGLQRKGFSEERVSALKRAWRHLHNPKLTTREALEKIATELGNQPDVARLLEFIASSRRGVILARGR